MDRQADTIAATAARLSVSTRTIYREIDAGKIRAVRARGRTLITREEQDRWLSALPAVKEAG
jgi:excisionase family DNA binding protein